jgi:carbamoyltransferase
MYILGLSAFAHDASAALIRDGEVRWLIEQERLDRVKHSLAFPLEAIRECLRLEGITLAEVDRITFFYRPLLELWGNIPHFLRHFPKTLNLLKASSTQETMGILERLRRIQGMRTALKDGLGTTRCPPIHFMEHHLCHASSAFHVSEFHEAAILSIDGRGESTSTLLAHGKGNEIRKLIEIKTPHSLGHLYAAVTQHLGFKPFFDEWKVMGMSAYGNPAFMADFKHVLRLGSGGSFELDLDYFGFYTHGRSRWTSKRFENTFGKSRNPEEPLEQRHFDLALALQRSVEEAGVHLARHLHKLTGLPNLCMAGGVVLNVLMNKRIMQETAFENVFIQPIAGDAGTSLGGALQYYHSVLRGPRQHVFQSPYLGPAFSNDEIVGVLRKNKLPFTKPERITTAAAKLIADGKIVGWFQGRMEAGPRALGNRSILVNPTIPDMKDRLNARVKKRESFRPFAPSVPEECASDYFQLPRNLKSPFMIMAGDVKPEARSLLPATTHADHTARVHTVDRKVNPLYWELIHEFGKISGVPVVLNTSFNENEPIVCTPDDAVSCFLRTEFDALAIGSYLVIKASG